MRRSGTLLLLAGAIAGCGAGGQADRSTLHHADGMTYRVPSGWHVAQHSLTPHLTNPRELLTAGTGRLPTLAGRCAHMPSAALAAMSPDDVLVTVQERFGSDRDFPSRPKRFGLDSPTLSEAAECAGPSPAFQSYWFGFRDQGRAFHVLVAVGTRASDERVREGRAILDSMRFVARRRVRMDPDDAIPEHDAAAGVDFVHPSAWRLYRAH
jgi:hypothetical protein